jgi:hypothetical protein
MKRNNNESREALSAELKATNNHRTTEQPNKIQQKGDCPGRDFALSLLHAGTN